MNKKYTHILLIFFEILTIVSFNCTTVNAQNYALRFDGVNDYVTANGVADKVAEVDFTIEYWFRLNDAPTDFNSLAAFNQSDKSNRFETGVGYGLDRKIYVHSPYSDPQTTYGTTIIGVGVWYHVAVTYSQSDGNIKAYLNGELELTKTMNPTYCVKVTDLFSLGQEWDAPDPSGFMKGDLDEFRVWDDLRTVDEIKANIYSELSGAEENLVTYYNMNEGSGTTLTDNSINTVTGTLVNMAGTEWVASPLNRTANNALSFDGINDYVEIGDVIEGSVAHTEEAWIKWAGDNSISSNFQDIVLKPFITSTAITKTGNLHSNYGDGSVWGSGVTSVVAIPVNIWTHIATVREESGKIRLYINGVEDVNSTTITLSGSNDRLRCIGVGKYTASSFVNWFNGELDEVRIWNTARSASEIRENMVRSLDGDESGLAALYRFDQTGGSTLYDATLNAYNGTLINMDAVTDWVDSEAFTTWLGTTSSNWATSTNWSDGVPTATDNVGIYKWNTGSELSITGTANANNMVISTTARPTLTGELTIGGKLIVTGNGKITKSATGKLTVTKDLILENNANGAIKIE